MTNPNILYPFIYPKMVKETVFLKNCISNPNIIIGDYTYYHDYTSPERFEEKKCQELLFFVN